jgi:hypothetical protein
MKTAAEQIRESIAELEKRHNEAQSALHETARRIAELKAEAKKLTPERIRVPENIKFEECGDWLALVSPNGKCLLTANEMHGGTPFVNWTGNPDDTTADIITHPLYLEPCKREDLKCGDVYWSSDDNSGIFFNDIDFYGVVLNEKESASWEKEMTMIINDDEEDNYDFWYKVAR